MTTAVLCTAVVKSYANSWVINTKRFMQIKMPHSGMQCGVCASSGFIFIFYFLVCNFLFFSFISCFPSLKWVMYNGSNYPSPSQHLYHICLCQKKSTCVHAQCRIHLFTMANSISSWDSWKQSLFGLSCAGTVEGRSHHQRLSFTEGYLHRRSSYTEGRHPPRVVIHQRLFSPAGHFPLKVVFWRRLSST